MTVGPDFLLSLFTLERGIGWQRRQCVWLYVVTIIIPRGKILAYYRLLPAANSAKLWPPPLSTLRSVCNSGAQHLQVSKRNDSPSGNPRCALFLILHQLYKLSPKLHNKPTIPWAKICYFTSCEIQFTCFPSMSTLRFCHRFYISISSTILMDLGI